MGKQFLALALFVGTILALLAAKASPHPLPKDKEAGVLFMLFENQNRKILASEVSDCKKIAGSSLDWSCTHKTVKSVLMDAMFLGMPMESYAKQNKLECEQLTKLMRDGYKDRMGFEWGPKEFRREVSQALDGQWLCTFNAYTSPYHEMMVAKQDEPKANIVDSKEIPEAMHQLKLAKAVPEVHTTVFGLTFLVNRDQSRIVSRNIVAWSNF